MPPLLLLAKELVCLIMLTNTNTNHHVYKYEYKYSCWQIQIQISAPLSYCLQRSFTVLPALYLSVDKYYVLLLAKDLVRLTSLPCYVFSICLLTANTYHKYNLPFLQNWQQRQTLICLKIHLKWQNMHIFCNKYSAIIAACLAYQLC